MAAFAAFLPEAEILKATPLKSLACHAKLSSGGKLIVLMDGAEHQVPELWRAKFAEIAAAFAAGDFQLCKSHVEGVEPVDQETADHIAGNVAAYVDRLAPLAEATWHRSIYRWTSAGGYWEVLVDLSTVSEPVSDLTLHAKVYEADCSRLKIDSVHVP
jgi:hypothetical protein